MFQELSKRLDAEMQRMKTTLTTELPRINAVLKRETLAPVDPSAKPEPKEPPKPQ